MTIAGAREFCKSLVDRTPRTTLLLSILLVSTSAAFGLGLMAGRSASAGQGSRPFALPEQLTGTLAPAGDAADQVVASKGGTKYYPSSCSAAARITEANKVYFASPALAEAAGYSRAANCK